MPRSVLFYSKQIGMNVQVAMEDVNKHVRTQLVHFTALVDLDTISMETFAPVMTSMNVLLVTRALANALILLDHSSAGVVGIKHMIQSLTGVLHQTTAPVTLVNIDASVAATLITATVCLVMIWQWMVVVVMTSTNVNLLMEDAVRCVLINQGHISVLAIQDTHLMAMVILAVAYNAQIHQP